MCLYIVEHKNKFKSYKPKFISTLRERDFDDCRQFSPYYIGKRSTGL